MALTMAERVKLFPEIKEEVLDVPDLISIQKDSFDCFLTKGLKEELINISPIIGYGGRFELEFLEGYEIGEPEYDARECLLREITLCAPLKVPTRLIDKETGEVKVQEVFMGDIPIMTEKGTFIINGAERVIVSQFVRSPGVYFKEKVDNKTGKSTFLATIIPNRGAWLEVEVDTNNLIFVHVNKMKKLPITVLLGAVGYSVEEVNSICVDKEFIRKTMDKSPITSPREALLEIHRRLRPGDPVTPEGAKVLLNNLFFDPKKYDLGEVGRYKINRRLGLNISKDILTLTKEDIVGTMNYIISLSKGEGITDDIDHLGNRRIRSVGELLQKQFRVGLARLERLIREQMTLKAQENIVPQSLINIRPLVAVMREFFGSSQLSQFMDQTNPLAELTHKRRLSALGPGGLTRERAGFEVRDIHPSHYGRICPIETPEGPNAGLISPLGTYARINEFGFIETPYRKVIKGVIQDQVDFLTADVEDKYRIAPYDIPSDGKNKITQEKVPVRYKRNFVFTTPEEVDYLGVSPKQLVGINSSLIPFLEHDDANRALMGSNMQRQATPLLWPDRPYVGTGMEKKVVRCTAAVITAKNDGVVKKVDAQEIVIEKKDGKKDIYKLVKYQRSNQNTCWNQKPIVKAGDKVKEGQVIVDGPATREGELALGKNVLVAFLPWEGYNYEDAILINERLVKDDIFTSVHVNRFEVEVRTTKLGVEEITREVPNVGDEALKNLDERGIIRIGAEVEAGDILVGKVTPKGETEPPAEEKLLRAIFGDKARDMRDTSLRVSSGESGKVIDVRVFSRDNNDDLPPGVNQIVRVYVAQQRKISIGDKMAGRHGNKGVISRILPEEDMPFMPDGTPVDIVFNPLGVPSRMNVGQIFETMLGLAGHVLQKFYEVQPFDEFFLEEASAKGVERELKEAIKKKGHDWLTLSGKINLRDGRTGESFDQAIMCGYMYVLKLIHLVEEKIHARSTGPYSLVTQQPLGGKAQFGGQRFGEMEVWALEGYGAAYTLQELLTIKSDDVAGRARAYESIIKGKNLSRPGTPESFRVLVRELRSIGLDVRILTNDGNEVDSR
ncbi:MAG: DNA-directed RNA polymerase subunit beta [Candidatus Margulisbacteria bacterium]|nr:DNA-directed RNA polymerase subunit beta [Candidatus Margulisiibacteriota bacterium]